MVTAQIGILEGSKSVSGGIACFGSMPALGSSGDIAGPEIHVRVIPGSRHKANVLTAHAGTSGSGHEAKKRKAPATGRGFAATMQQNSELSIPPQHLAAALANAVAHRGERRAAAEQIADARAGVGAIAVS